MKRIVEMVDTGNHDTINKLYIRLEEECPRLFEVVTDTFRDANFDQMLQAAEKALDAGRQPNAKMIAFLNELAVSVPIEEIKRFVRFD